MVEVFAVIGVIAVMLLAVKALSVRWPYTKPYSEHRQAVLERMIGMDDFVGTRQLLLTADDVVLSALKEAFHSFEYAIDKVGFDQRREWLRQVKAAGIGNELPLRFKVELIKLDLSQIQRVNKTLKLL